MSLQTSRQKTLRQDNSAFQLLAAERNAARDGCASDDPPNARSLRHALSSRRTPMAKEKTLHELFHDTLKDIYFAEKKILTALPKMAKAAQSEDLQAAFKKHEGETE